MSKILATRFADRPVMVGADQSGWLSECISAVSAEMAHLQARAAEESVELADSFWPAEGHWMSRYRPYEVVAGTLQIPVKGLLLHDYGYQLGDWATGYTYIQKAFERGIADPGVQRIALVINSGGGEVAGNFDMVDRIYQLRDQKPIQAFVNEHAYSAAYSIASAADKISVARTGGVGSIGVVTSHMDVSGAMEKSGYKITFIHAGAHKVDGNPYAALSPEVKNRMQARIDGLYSIFVSTVARNLGIDEQVVRDTEALTYGAEEAVALGLAHEIAPFDEALAAFSSGGINPVGEEVMSQPNPAPDTAQVTEAALEAARAEGRNEGATAERERIQGILGCDEAANRRDLAFHLAMNTDQTVETARGILAVSPETVAKVEQPSTPGAQFAAAMENGNPELGAEGGDGQPVDQAAQLIADYKAATGYGSEK